MNRIRNRWTKWLFPFIALALLLPWPVAYAFDVQSGDDGIPVEVAEPSVRPHYVVFGKAIGGVNPGDLFYIDATNNAADIVVTLYLTNAQELIQQYTFMILNLGIYLEEAGKWKEASGSNGELLPNTVLSMRNGQVTFLLPGYSKYKLTIDSGSFYAVHAEVNGQAISPSFHLEVN